MGEVVPTAPCGLQAADVYEKGMVETEEAVERDKTRAGCVASATGCVGGVVVDRVEGGVNGPVVVCANGLVANGLVMGFRRGTWGVIASTCRYGYRWHRRRFDSALPPLAHSFKTRLASVPSWTKRDSL